MGYGGARIFDSAGHCRRLRVLHLEHLVIDIVKGFRFMKSNLTQASTEQNLRQVVLPYRDRAMYGTWLADIAANCMWL